MRGDIVFYKAKKGDFADWLISHFTNGPFVHVEIDLGDGMFIGEHGGGIEVHGQDIFEPDAFITPKVKVASADLNVGMNFVTRVANEDMKDPKSHRYGWLDIASDVLKIIGAKTILRREGQWDCSHFVTLYLIAAHAEGPLGVQAKNPETVSPNDLARAFGLIK